MKTLPLISFIAAAMVGPLSAQSLVGGWYISNAGDARSDAVLAFLDDGTYVMAENGNRKLDPNGRNGMERGTYQWNASTNKFSVKTLVDTSGQWGMSHANFESATVKGNKLIITDDGGRFTLERIASGTNPIVGTWFLKEGDGYAIVSFLANGSYFMAQDGKAAHGGKTGMERGTYTWNASTKAFTRKVLVDTNGTWGFSDKLKRSVSISGNKLSLTVAGEGTYELARVVAPKLPLIGVQQPVGSNLADGTAKRSFGTVVIGSKGAVKTFTIRNKGTAKLTKLAISKSGSHAADFIVGAPGATALAPGASTTFKVTFKPTVKGQRNAAIKISSNDSRSGPFDILLNGQAVVK